MVLSGGSERLVKSRLNRSTAGSEPLSVLHRPLGPAVVIVHETPRRKPPYFAPPATRNTDRIAFNVESVLFGLYRNLGRPPS